MPLALEQFIQQLEDTGILAGDTLRDFISPKANPKDAEELARELVRQRKLTKFQAEEVYRGKGKTLVLGNYVLMEKIGAGGMGQVFKARHKRMDRIVAVKLLAPAMMKDRAAIARFDREVKAAAKLRHPNIVAADDADEANGIHFLVMELVDGSDLSALVKKDGRFSVEKSVSFILQAARGLEAAHAEGIVHRDIKPSNLLLDKKGVVKILDMGLARIQGDVAGQAELTGTGAVMGTVDYMAPEQALSSKHVDARADIYSLGCSLHYLMTGTATFEGDTLMAKLLAHRDQPIPSLRASRSDVPEKIDGVFKKMIAKKKEERYQTMTEVIADLEKYSGHTTVVAESGLDLSNPWETIALSDISVPAKSVAKRKKAPKQKWKWGTEKQKPWMIGGLAAAAILLLAGLVFTLKTKNGTLVVNVNEPDADVQVLDEQGKVEIKRKGDSSSLSITVEPGKHQLRVEKNGFEFFTQEFTLKSGGRESIKATLVPLKPKEPPPVETVTSAAPATNAIQSRSGDSGDGWVSLFNGKDLSGWKSHPADTAKWEVKDGILTGSGPGIGHLYTQRNDYTNFLFRVEAKVNDRGNGGQYFRAAFKPVFPHGYEAQINSTQPDIKTGGLYGVEMAPGKEIPVKPDEWFTQEVVANGNHIMIFVNGFKTVDYTDNANSYVKGHLALQHTQAVDGKETLIQFRKIEVKEINSPTATDSVASAAAGNPPPKDAAEFQGRYYKFFPEVMTWHQAKKRCEEMGGHLAVINSVAENEFVVQLARKGPPQMGELDGAWLGATDEQNEGEWKWINGKSMDFNVWGPGQPNNKQNNEHYLMLFTPTSEWSDQPTKSEQHTVYFICQWDKARPD